MSKLTLETALKLLYYNIYGSVARSTSKARMLNSESMTKLASNGRRKSCSSDEKTRKPSILQWTESPEQLTHTNIQQQKLTIFTRSLPIEVELALNSQSELTLAGFHKLIDLDNANQSIEKEIVSQRLCPLAVRNWLAKDIGDLVKFFGKVCNTAFVDTRLEWIHHDACWKFHRDFVNLRLLTTYVGKTTEWVDTTKSKQALEKQRAYRGPVNCLNLYDIAIFTGCKKEPENGIVHRSPPLQVHDQPRLFLCLNITDELSVESFNED